LKQPKHLTLTSRNVGVLTREVIGANLRGIASIRRRKFADQWQSGSWTMEITNEGRGWHVHFHLLIETRWIDAPVVARAWAKAVGQEDAAIVCVKDCRSKEYLAEVAKYVCKSEALAAWTPLDIVQLMDALRKRRAFGIFGDAVGLRADWKRQLKEIRRDRTRCECGANNWNVEFDRPRLDKPVPFSGCLTGRANAHP
jgi:hypothetical protein